MGHRILWIFLCSLLLWPSLVDGGFHRPQWGFRGIRAQPPKSGECFGHNDPTWEAAEELAWAVLTEQGSRGWERRLLMTTLYNETRGRWHLIGDAGCAHGGFQLHVGGTVQRKAKPKRWQKRVGPGLVCCLADNRRYFPDDMQELSPEKLRDPTLNTRGALALMRQKGSEQNPFHALARYSGVAPKGARAERIWGRHKHWWQTGLGRRIKLREGEGVKP